MLILMTLAIVTVVTYFYMQEGLYTAATMLVNVLLAGILTFNFFEPLATELGRLFQNSIFKNYEDALCMTLLFSVALGILRALTNRLNDTVLAYSPVVQQIGGAAFGAVIGYLICGFLVCILQTLPWNQHFLDFEPRAQDESPLRRYLPPDRLWLALMHRAGTYAFSRSLETEEEETPFTFDSHGAFETNHLRLRRYLDK